MQGVNNILKRLLMSVNIFVIHVDAKRQAFHRDLLVDLSCSFHLKRSTFLRLLMEG